jgi:hypothetical protein
MSSIAAARWFTGGFCCCLMRLPTNVTTFATVQLDALLAAMNSWSG